jgi:TolB protein
VNSSDTDTNVVVSDLDGSGERPLTTAPGVDGDPEWSPDGTKLVFSSDRDRNGPCLFHDCTGFAPELYVMNADGTGVRRLTTDRGYDIGATWSPDGKQILFGRIGDQNDDYELYVVSVDGGQRRRLTDNSGWDLMPDWSATGTR